MIKFMFSHLQANGMHYDFTLSGDDVAWLIQDRLGGSILFKCAVQINDKQGKEIKKMAKAKVTKKVAAKKPAKKTAKK